MAMMDSKQILTNLQQIRDVRRSTKQVLHFPKLQMAWGQERERDQGREMEGDERKMRTKFSAHCPLEIEGLSECFGI